MGQKKLLLLILQELNSINSKLYKSQDPEPRIAMKQRVSETPFAKSVLAAMDILADGIEVKPQVGMLDALANPALPVIVKCGVLPDVEQNEDDNEFEDTSEPEPYIQKELTKEEEEAEFLAVRKQIDGQLKDIRDKQNEYNASNHNGA